MFWKLCLSIATCKKNTVLSQVQAGATVGIEQAGCSKTNRAMPEECSNNTRVVVNLEDESPLGDGVVFEGL